ncbi:HamA C-terminal domain-containing protein [Thioalbus denitrificans]|uniref:Uncharacterized protein DUF1837 n=1 Tax=Thioalbus denitrificans TaxID=547122 RepID=A0A369C108_9GAMM|nr:DUF1837 domain-containing protein [Thioalbus denitrificans]RCX26496.1 uncharacterized protein DUF1837 [Thioalbus denitrificans]
MVHEMLSNDQLQELLADTSAFIQHVHYFVHDLPPPPGASARGIAINTVDLAEKKDDFLRELRNTVCNWVYSKSRYKELFDRELEARGYDIQNAASHIDSLARTKFRRGFPQGQFGELLLFNFLQFFFNAPPILRKMPITTNTAIERHGSDAIHYTYADGSNIILLGEAKTYKSKYKFNSAFSDALTSILSTYHNIDDELFLYVYDEFIEEPLRDIARQLKDGQLPNTRYELVCIISYEETNKKDSHNEAAIKQSIEKIVKERFNNADASMLNEENPALIQRIHYIVFPFWGLEKILSDFDANH